MAGNPIQCFGCSEPVISYQFIIVVVSWPATMWGPAIVMVRIFRPSVCLSHANVSKTKRDRLMVTMKLE